MSFFQQSCKTLARALVGKTLRVGEKSFQILKAEGYPRKDNETGIYAPILEMRPGAVYCPPHRGGLLFLIACPDGQGPGGCVLIREVSFEGTAIKGPGRVAEALGITDAKSSGRLTEVKDSLNLQM
jgi:3-methyladenine DNA glycosylase Mpg